jgi:hypothetical protein
MITEAVDFLESKSYTDEDFIECVSIADAHTANKITELFALLNTSPDKEERIEQLKKELKNVLK